MDEQIAKHIWNECKKLEGKTIKCDNASNNMLFIQHSKEAAKQYEWLYHCTNSSAFLSILSNKEFWLTNLKCVNDAEEAERIDVPEYEKSYYVTCFTYSNNILDEHWKEYGNIKNGVLVGIKREWFIRQADFMCGNAVVDDEFFKIYPNYDSALASKIEKQSQNKLSNPFYINSFDFYQVIYDDKLTKNIKGNSYLEMPNGKLKGQTFTPDIAGIIKKTSGLCKRNNKESYIKDWASEKEVRLKIGIQQFSNVKNGYEIHDGMIMDKAYLSKVRVPLQEQAFETIKIRFSPNFVNKNEFIEKIRSIIPNSIVEILG